EYVHDGVSRIEEDPVAKRRALDLWRRKAGVATGPYDPVGNRADVHAGTAGGDDHPIGERRLSRELDRNDVFRLCVLKSFKDDLRQGVGRRRVVRDGRAAGAKRRSSVRRECQRRVPLRAGSIRARALQNMRPPRALFKLAVRSGAHVVNTILPMWSGFSIRSCAFRASARGDTESMTGLKRPATKSGHTLARKHSAMTAFSAGERGRKVEPVWMRRL